jgi:drug/metabolite transporter (DMT)-like permease
MQNQSRPQAGRAAALVVLCYTTVYIVWGSTYFFIRQAVLTIPPLYVVGLRWTVGGGLLLAFTAATGRLKKLPSLRQVGSSVLLGFLLLLVGNGLISIAERTIDSYIAALASASTPILVALFDRVLLKKRLAGLRAIAVAGGFAGVALLLYNGQPLGSALNTAILIDLAGVLSWSLATSLGHRFPVPGDSLVNSGVQMFSVGVVALGGSLLLGARPAQVLAGASPLSWLSVLYLAVVGAVAYAAFTYLVTREPAERVVSYALVNPLIALLLGLGLGAEKPTPLLWAGVPLVLAALALMLYGERIARWLPSRTARRG